MISNNRLFNECPTNIWPDTFGRFSDNEIYQIPSLYNRTHNSKIYQFRKFFPQISQIMEVVLDLIQRQEWEELFDHIDKEFENELCKSITRDSHVLGVF